MTNPLGIDVEEPRFSWQLDCGHGWTNCERGDKQSAYRIVVSTDPCGSGGSKTVWDSGRVDSNMTSNIAYAGSEALSESTRYVWKVTSYFGAAATPIESAEADFTTGIGNATWASQKWVSPAGAGSSGLLRREFSLPGGSVCRAVAYVSAPGGFTLLVNGREATDRLGVMEWMQFDRTSIYYSLDITSMLSASSDNAVGFILGSGVWVGYFLGELQARVVIDVYMSDGSRTRVSSDKESDWMSSPGFITSNDPWKGTTTDWTKVEAGWASPGFKPSSAWKPAVAPGGKGPFPSSSNMQSLAMPLSHVIEEIKPVKAVKLGTNWYRYDMPINMVGVVRVDVPAGAPSGSSLWMKHGEVLMPNGSASFPWDETEQTDVHILDGQVRSVTPRFTWHGFQQVEIRASGGLELDGNLSMITGLVIHTDVEHTGNATFKGGKGSGLLTEILAMTKRGQLDNMAAYMPTDCPTREKHGWLGDALSTAEEAMYNFNAAPVYRRFLKTIVDSSKPSGDPPGAVPNKGPMTDVLSKGHDGGQTDISWTGGFPQIARWLMLYFGDTRSAEEVWPALVKYMDNLAATASPPGLADDWTWGDWCAIEARDIATPNTGPLLAAFNYLLSLDAMTEMAAVLGKKADESKFGALASKLRPAFYSTYYNTSTGLFGKSSLEAQSCTAASLVLGDGVFPSAKDRADVVQRFGRHVNVTDRGHLTFGSVGAKHVLPTLTAEGLHDLAMGIALQETFPSFGYWISQGATTPWEDWSGIADPTHPPPPTHNHIFLAGGVTEWLYRSVAGIAPGANGYNHIIIHPNVLSPKDGPFGAGASLTTVRGDVSVEWQMDAHGGYDVTCVIPPGATATVHIPNGEDPSVTVMENGGTVWGNGHFQPGDKGVISGRATPHAIVLEVESGSYFFTTILG